MTRGVEYLSGLKVPSVSGRHGSHQLGAIRAGFMTGCTDVCDLSIRTPHFRRQLNQLSSYGRWPSCQLEGT